MADPDFNCLVIGAGVVGIAIARALALSGKSVLQIERHAHFGHETSSRSSEVIHAGIYYSEGSLKARMCVEGRRAMYDYLAARGIPHIRCGKLIVASNPEQAHELARFLERGRLNGVKELSLIEGAELNRLEPELAGFAALHSPSTGVLDSHTFMLSLVGDAEDAGAQIAFNTAFTGAHRSGELWQVRIEGEPNPVVSCRTIVNAAGLAALPVAQSIEGYTNPSGYAAFYAKGTYFGYSGRVPFSRLIYPVPEPGGLGVHLTLDLQGRARFGPNVQWIATPEYSLHERDRDRFARSIRSFWPGLDAAKLYPDYAGVRPKIAGPGEEAADFIVELPEDHGIDGLVNLLGIESPGLTSSLALGDYVLTHLDD